MKGAVGQPNIPYDEGFLLKGRVVGRPRLGFLPVRSLLAEPQHLPGRRFHDKVPIGGIECRPDQRVLVISPWAEYFEISGLRVQFSGYEVDKALQRGVDRILCASLTVSKCNLRKSKTCLVGSRETHRRVVLAGLVLGALYLHGQEHNGQERVFRIRGDWGRIGISHCGGLLVGQRKNRHGP